MNTYWITRDYMIAAQARETATALEAGKYAAVAMAHRIDNIPSWSPTIEAAQEAYGALLESRQAYLDWRKYGTTDRPIG